jgi:hypothetical protein
MEVAMENNDRLFTDILEPLALVLGIIEVALTQDKALRREDMYRIKGQILKVTTLIRERREIHRNYE